MLNPVTDKFLNELSRQLPDGTLRPVADKYLEDPRGNLTGHLGGVAAPADTSEMQIIMRAAAAARVGLVPFGGGTGLVGGQIQPSGPDCLLISTERMNRVRNIYPEDNIAIVEAGVVLHDLQESAAQVERLFPLSLASEGSCTIGGNLGTNAGGINVLRYGNARDLCLGVEAVLPDGQVYNGLKRLRKDNTGYDISNLLIGSEGTLGVITAAVMRLFPRPQHQAAAFMVVPDPAAAVSLLSLAQDIAGAHVSAFELIGKTALEFLAEEMPDVRQPFADKHDWMVLIDLGMSASENPEDALTTIFEHALAAELVSDGIIAKNETQRSAFFALRESIPHANRKVGAIVSTDISVPIGVIAEFIARGTDRLVRHDGFRVNCFGHVGDGNLHFNIFAPAGQRKADHIEKAEDIRRFVHDLVAEYGGSFSAEHGVGRLKVQDLDHYGDPGKLSAMRAIKAALDPLGIMNPGAVLNVDV